jgi:hypothetical protein
MKGEKILCGPVIAAGQINCANVRAMVADGFWHHAHCG